MEGLAGESISLMGEAAPCTDAPRLGSAGAAFIMLKSALGAGLLNFPWAFHKAGGVSAAVGVEMASLVFLISGLVILVSHSLHMVKRGSSEVETPSRWYMDRRLTLSALCLLVILPLSLPKGIGFQKYTSVLGTLAAVYLTVAVVVRHYMREEPTASPQFGGSVMPTICFGFQCHEAAVPIYSSLENKALPHWALISVVSMLVCLFIYSLTGIFGYVTFGKDVAEDILMSYPGDDLVMIVDRLLFGVSIITIYPITLLLGSDASGTSLGTVTPLLSVLQDLLPFTWACEKRADVGLTVAWISTTLLAAVFVPDISDVISIIGGISTFFIFIFPGLCLMFSMQSVPVSPMTRVVLTSWGTITLLCGVFIFGQCTAIAIMDLLAKF